MLQFVLPGGSARFWNRVVPREASIRNLNSLAEHDGNPTDSPSLVVRSNREDVSLRTQRAVLALFAHYLLGFI